MSQDTNHLQPLNSPIYKLSGDIIYIIDINDNNLYMPTIQSVKENIQNGINACRNPYQEWYIEEHRELLKQYDEIYGEDPISYSTIITPIDLYFYYLDYIKRLGYTPNRENRRCINYKDFSFDDFLDVFNDDAKDTDLIYDENKILVEIDTACQRSIKEFEVTYKAKEFEFPRCIDTLHLRWLITSKDNKELMEQFPKEFEKYNDIRELSTKKYNEYVKNNVKNTEHK